MQSSLIRVQHSLTIALVVRSTLSSPRLARVAPAAFLDLLGGVRSAGHGRAPKAKPAPAEEKGRKGGSPPAAALRDASAEEEAPPEEGKDLATTLSRQVDYVRRELAKLRGATASATMLDHVVVELYGERQALPEVAQIALKGAGTIVVNPFDGAAADAIADAIRDSDLNLNPLVEGTLVRVPIPKPSKETREATARLVAKAAEQAKTRIRRVRAGALEKLKKLALPEDDARRETKAIDEATAAATQEVAKIAEKKRLEVESGV